MKNQKLQRVSCLRRRQHEIFETIRISDDISEDNLNSYDSNPYEKEIAKEIEIAESNIKLIPKIDLS